MADSSLSSGPAAPRVERSSVRIRSSLRCCSAAELLRGGPDRPPAAAPLAERRALIRGRQKTAAEAIHAARRDHAAVEHDEAGQVLALAAQAVGDPGAHAGAALLAVAGVHEIVGVGVLGELETIERTTARSSTQVPMCGNRSLTGMPLWPYWRNFQGLFSTLPTLSNCVGWTLAWIGWPFSRSSRGLGSNVSTCDTPAVHEQKDHVLGPGRKVRRLRRQGVRASGPWPSRHRRPHRRPSAASATAPKSAGGAHEHLAARQRGTS